MRASNFSTALGSPINVRQCTNPQSVDFRVRFAAERLLDLCAAIAVWTSFQ